MKRITAIIFLFILILIPGYASAKNAEISVTGIYDYDSAYEILSMINDERTSRGLGEVSMNEDLLDFAMQRAAEISVCYGHTRPDGGKFISVFPEGFDYMMAAENIAAGQENYSKVMTDWMNSEGHRKNILTDGFETVGVGCFYQPEIGIRTWVQLFTANSNGGYVTSGKVTTTAVVVSDVNNFTIFCYNPAISKAGYNVYNTICPGKGEEFAIVGVNGGKGADFILFVPDEDSYEFRGITPNVTADGKTVTASEGKATLGFFSGGVEIGRYSYEVKHTYSDAEGNPPTCTQGGYEGSVCLRCGHEGEGKYVGPLGHMEVEYPAREATCTEEGNTSGIYCPRCGIFFKEPEVIPLKHHKYEKHTKEPTCLDEGYDYYTCISCNDSYTDKNSVVPAPGHKWDEGHVDINTGDRVFFCETCGEVKFQPAYEVLDEKIYALVRTVISYESETAVNELKKDYLLLDEEQKFSMKYEPQLLELIRIFEVYRMGDVDLSGRIDAADLSIVLSFYGMTNTPADIAGDDGIVNSTDLSMVLYNYSKVR